MLMSVVINNIMGTTDIIFSVVLMFCAGDENMSSEAEREMLDLLLISPYQNSSLCSNKMDF